MEPAEDLEITVFGQRLVSGRALESQPPDAGSTLRRSCYSGVKAPD